jgi:CRP/FNR family transcriptional regulator, cyclic AMP receptor protein
VGPDGWTPGTLLHGLGSADRAALLGLGTRRSYQPGEVLIREGAAVADVFLLLDGYVKVLGTSVEGRTVLLSVRGAGDVVGELAALDGKPRCASVVALGAVAVRTVPPETFLRYLQGRPLVAAAVHRAVVAELRRATRHQVFVNGASVESRLAHILDYLAESFGQPCAEGVRIRVPISQPELASLIGVSAPSLQRALGRLRARGLVATRYRNLIVRDRAALIPG